MTESETWIRANQIQNAKENQMKRKSILFNSFIPLLTLTFVLVICLPSPAQEKASEKKAAAQSQKSKKQREVTKKDATYWFRKGSLVATYGNDKAAIKFFQKAIALNPNHSGAHFEQGISYGQLGNYQKSISLINRAINMEPQNGIYYYGRARVYLLSGSKNKAMKDFKKAAELDDEDAMNYLEYIDKMQ